MQPSSEPTHPVHQGLNRPQRIAASPAKLQGQPQMGLLNSLSTFLLYRYTDDDGFTHTVSLGVCSSGGGGGGSYTLGSGAADYGFAAGGDGSYIVNTSVTGFTNPDGSVSWGPTSTFSVSYGQNQNGSGPDFVTLSLGFEEVVNLNANITVTRHGQVFIAPAIGLGASPTVFDGNLAFGTMSGSNGPQAMSNFFKGVSTNVGYSLAILGYGTSNNSSGSTDDFVVGTPGVWANVSWGWNIFDAPFLGW